MLTIKYYAICVKVGDESVLDEFMLDVVDGIICCMLTSNLIRRLLI